MSNIQKLHNGSDDNYHSASQHNPPPNDEIDLMALFAVLLKNKFLIILVTFLVTLASFGITSLLPQKWSSTAVIIPPTSEEIKDINALSAKLSVLDINVDLTPSRIFSSFIDQFRSKVNQESYVRSTTYYQELLRKAEPADADNLTIINQQKLVNGIISNNIKIQDLSKEKNSVSDDIVLTFIASTPTEAQDLLDGYVRYSASKVRLQFKKEIDNAIAQRLVFANETFKKEVSEIRTKYDVKVERLKRALDIAKAAGVVKPIASESLAINDDPDYPIALGTEALEKKLLIETQNRDIELMSESLQNRQNYIKEISELTTDELKFLPVKFILAPNLPIIKDSPKTSLIVALSAILGLIFSCAFVLSREMYRDYKRQNA